MTFTGSFKTEHTMEDALRTEMRTSRAFFTYFLLFTSVSNCGALAPEWRFGNSLWRQKLSQAPRKKVNFSVFSCILYQFEELSWEIIKIKFFF